MWPRLSFSSGRSDSDSLAAVNLLHLPWQQSHADTARLGGQRVSFSHRNSGDT